MADYKRRVRIEGKPGDVAGYMLTVKDAKTGEDVTNVASVVIKLNPTQVNVADITYIEPDDHAQERFVRVVAPSDNPEVSLTAFETLPNRDTQFATFAKLLLAEMMGEHGYIDFNDWDTEVKDNYEQMIARRAYDLVQHTIHSVDYVELECCDSRDELLPTIPDMTELPKESH